MGIEEVYKVSVFDFDGTLIDTALPGEGKKIWKEKTGTEYPHAGWWGRKESLYVDVYDNAPFDDVVSDYRKAVSEPNTHVSLCTGRMVKLSNEVNAILNKYNFKFDDVVLNGDGRFSKGSGDTVAFKIRYLASLQKTFPNLKEIEFWDDRDEHIPTFKQWGDQQRINVIVNHVHQADNRF
jgi:pyruvate-formate lyase